MPKVEPKRSTRSSPGGFSACCRSMLSDARAEAAAVHRAQHLDVADRVEAKALRDALADDLPGSWRRRPRRRRIRRSRKSLSARAAAFRHQPWLIRCALMMMRLSAACRNTSVSRTTGTAPEPMMSASTWPGPTDGSWSTSPTRINAAWSRHRLQQRVHQRHVDHRGLVDDEQVAVQRVVLLAPEAAVLRDRLPAADGWSSPRGRCSPTAASPRGRSARPARR